MNLEELQANYGSLFEKELLEEIAAVGLYKEIAEGEELIDYGQYIKSMPLLLNGVIKILRQDSDGDELLLYYLERGETCAMTLSCCLGQTKSQIKAISETKSEVVLIPVQKMEEWTSKYRSWRNFVFESYHSRLIEMLEAIDSIAFMKMDERLLKYLQDKVKLTGSNILSNTHQEIAYDLHTSRVVVSRLLKKLENIGKIKLYRNQIELL
jgi:CRP/FNR family transcriptional regulator